MLKAAEALERLRAGNARFVSDRRGPSAFSSPSQRVGLVSGQYPSAIVLGCSDSRVPAEIIFDQGLGDLFVIRVAGNVVASSQIASVEFAAEAFGTRLVVVLGHSCCGAVKATLDNLRDRGEAASYGNLHSIVGRIRPAIEELVAMQTTAGNDAAFDDAGLLQQAVRANIRASANQLRRGSGLLEGLIASDGLMVVGAEYSLETGVVDFFDGVPQASA